MGGRGTFASGNNVSFRWETVDVFNGIKVLDLIDKKLSKKLPEESHSSNAYLLLDKNGKFYQYREYNDKHNLVFEIGYHYEKKVSKHGPVLHVHEYSNDFKSRTTRSITLNEYNKYKDLFKGVNYDRKNIK